MATRVPRASRSALAAAPSAGVLPKDVKPGNVLLEGEAGKPRIRLTDFGIGRV